jgi:phosphate-selective porin OprO/OprP
MKTMTQTHRNRLLIAALTAGLSGTPALHAQEPAPTLEQLDQKIRVLERKLELADEAAAAKAKATPAVTAGPDGFALTSPDKAFALKLRGYAQTDGRFFIDDDANTGNDTVLLRRARVIVDGALGSYFDFRIAPDFGNAKSEVQDAYLDIKAARAATLRVGRTKVPFGLERLQSSAETLFVETALSTALTPNYDEGVTLYGTAGVLDYALGAFNGGPDGASVDSDSNDEKDLAARFFVTPFKNSDASALSGLSLGVAGTWGKQDGSETSPGLPSFKTSGQQTFFAYATSTNKGGTAYADGDRVRLAPQLYYAAGAFGFLGEYIVSAQDAANGSGSETVDNTGWQLAATFVLTGETPSLRGVRPLKPFNPAAGQWGAVELAARVSRLDVDDDAFDAGLADLKKSASAADSVGAGVNWYLTRNAKLILNYEQTTFDGGAAAGDRPDEKAVLARAQFSF